MNTMMLLEMAASGFGDRVAFTNPETNTSITYQELFDAAGAAAVEIKNSGANRPAFLMYPSITGLPTRK